MEIYDESLIKIMCNDQCLRQRGVTEDMLEHSLMRAMKYLESKRIDNYKIQNAILNQEITKKSALIAEKQVKELIENSQNIKKRL